MSHHPAVCPSVRETGKHAFSTWTTEEITNAAGEQQFILERRCYACPAIERETAMIVEDK